MARRAQRKSGKSIADKGTTEPISVSTGKLRDDPIAKQIEKTSKAVQGKPAREALLGLGREKVEAAPHSADQHILELQRIAELAQSGGLSNEKLTAELQQAIERLSGQKSGKSSAIPLESPNILKDLEIRGEPAGTVKLGKTAPKDELGTSLEQFRRRLDEIKAEVDASPALRSELQTHELFSDIASMIKCGDAHDPIVDEILRELPISWDDRKKPENKGQPWAKNASTYISHFMGKWIEAGQLEQGHIKAVSERLYKAYTGLIAYSPQWDLGLPKREHVRLDNPTEAITRVREKSKLRQKKLSNP